VLRGGKRSGTKTVPVKLAARLTEIGTLELWCLARNSDQRWRLEFQTRQVMADDAGEVAEPPVQDLWEEGRLQRAREVLVAAFSQREETGVKEVVRSLETALESSREHWPLAVCRRLWDFLADLTEQRRNSPAHLARWYNLAGWSLRPGCGDPLDQHRVGQLWKLLHTMASRPATTAGPRLGEGGPEWWILWRRVAGGLNSTLQQSLWDRLRPTLVPAKGKAISKPGAHEFAEMWRAAASLERLEPRWKQQMAEVLLKDLRRAPVAPHVFWALTRLGSRRLLYGPLNAIVHPDLVEQWLEVLLRFRPANDAERLAWQFCLVQLAQRTGERALDVSPAMHDQVLETLRDSGAAERLLRMLQEPTALDKEEQKRFLGDSLPIGLRVIRADAAEPRAT
jgi:hypothetical protein